MDQPEAPAHVVLSDEILADARRQAERIIRRAEREAKAIIDRAAAQAEEERNAKLVVVDQRFTKSAALADLYAHMRTGSDLAFLNGIINFDRYVSSLKTLYAGTELEKNYIEQAVLVENSDGAQPLSQYVDEWLDDPQAGFFTLLGDYGTGKTSFTKKIAHDMAVRYEKDKSQFRVPVLINLNDVSKALSLENIIFNHFSRTAQMSVIPETVLYLLKEGRLLLIFDGFDEMATQSNAALTMRNFMELNRAFAGSAKIILTCRTHYFKDRAETEETLKAKKRGLSESATELYRAIQGKQGYSLGYLQEFKASQIEEYLKKTLPDQWRDAKATIASVYNLKDLSSRPVLLDMIVKSLPKIREKAGTIQAADLYAAYVHSWIDREDWRHELTREGREFLAEEMAERIWEMETDRVHHSLINDVLKNYLQDKKSIVSVSDIELASSEVRTASFLIRDDEGNYGFAHRSFMEFFLAQRIAKRLKKVDTNCLRLKRLSKEVILFLSQLASYTLLISTARGIMFRPYEKMISENALLIYYWTHRYQIMRGNEILPLETLRSHFQKNKLYSVFLDGADLEQTDLSGICIENVQMNGANLGSSVLAGAILQHASLIGANLSFASFDSAYLAAAKMSRVKADHASFSFSIITNVDFTDSDLHASSMVSAFMSGAILEKADLSSAGLLKAKGVPDTLTAFGIGLPNTSLFSLLPSVQLGHSSSVTSVAFSPDGKILVTGSWDKTARLWDVASGREIKTIQAHSGSVTSVTFSPDGKTLVTGSWDKTARLWDVESGREIKTFQAHSDSISSVAVSPDGKTLVTGGWDKTARLWDVESGREIMTLQAHSEVVTSVAFSPDGKIFATGSRDKTARLWDVESGREIRTLQTHSASIASVAFSPDGKILVTGGWDNTARLWDVEYGREIRTIHVPVTPVTSVVFSHNGTILATGGMDGTARLWDVASGKEIRPLQACLESIIESIAFSPDGSTLATGSVDNTARLWDVASGREIRTLQAHSEHVTSVAFSPDGSTLATGSVDKTARLWDVASSREIRTLQAHSEHVTSVAFSPDGKTLGTGSYDNTARLWDVASGREIRTLQAHSEHVTSVAFSPDGSTLATGSVDNTTRLWDVASGREIRTLQAHSEHVTSVAFSPDGSTLATGSVDKTARLWDVASGSEIGTLQAHSEPVASVAFSPDGKTLATGSRDNTARLWDVASGSEIGTLQEHSGHVTSVTFSPDGSTLATGSWDGTSRLWNIGTGTGKPSASKEIAALYHLPDAEWAAIAPDNRFVCSEGAKPYIYFADRLALYSAYDLPELEQPEGLELTEREQVSDQSLSE
ncbi:MAG: NACHT domain-containing protein [Nitrospirales bacterium]|nr:NACHT domain-containing protein [Nitrospirales bacterium]